MPPTRPLRRLNSIVRGYFSDRTLLYIKYGFPLMIFTTVKNKEVTTLKKIKTWFKFSVKRISYFATFFQNSLFSHFFPLKHNKYFRKRGSGFATLLRMYFKTIKHFPCSYLNFSVVQKTMVTLHVLCEEEQEIKVPDLNSQ